MKHEDHNKNGFNQIMGRDGFSPDLPTMNGKSVGFMLRALMYIFKGIRIGQLDVTLPNGEQRIFRGSERPELHAVLNIRDKRVGTLVVKNGEVGFGDAYLEGCWDSPDLSSLLILLYLNEPYYAGPYEKNFISRFLGWVSHKLKHNNKANAQKNIQYHYDLGNEFYKMWLDDTMAYSSGMFIQPNETLMDSQLNKFKLMYDRLDLKPEHHLLEIGSGWGGFAIYAAQHSGCRVTSITLSKEQLEEARIRADKAGVGDRVHFELRDYRDVMASYDRVVSIEMYEAVGEEYWPGYFAAIHKALKPGGRAAIQGITISPKIYDNYRSKQDFIQKYIFPGGMLATPEIFSDLAGKAGLKSVAPLFYAKDYADTLACWHRNVLAVRDKVVEQFDERFLRMWRYYLSYCEAGFRTGSIDLMQITLTKA